METGLEIHLVHDNVKMQIRKYVNLTDEDNQFFNWNSEYYNIYLEFHKKSQHTFSEITERGYGKDKKVLRFTKQSNGKTGINLIIKVPYEKVKDVANGNRLWSKEYVGEEFSFNYTVEFKENIIDVLKERRKSQKASKISKPKSSERTVYPCYNPKPLQGGSFSGK